MTRIGISFEDVEKAAETILARGENPTIEKIRRELGTGSNSTITKHLNEWRANRLFATTDQMPAPNLPPDSVHAAVNQVWEKLRDESETKIKAIQVQAKNEIEIAQIELNQVISEREKLQQELDNNQKRLNQISADKEILILHLKILEQEHLLLQEKFKHKESEFNLLKQESNTQITILQSNYEKERVDKNAIIASIQESHKTSINKFVETHENYRQQYMIEMNSFKVEREQLNKINEKLSIQNQTLKQELAEAKIAIKMLSSEHNLIKQELDKKDKIIENNHSIFQSIQLILHEIKKISDTEIRKEILSKIKKLDNKFNNYDETLKSILNLLTKSHEAIEEN